MPVQIGDNIAASRDRDPSNRCVSRMTPNRRASRLSVYLNTINLNDESDEELSIFNENDVGKVLVEQRERQHKTKNKTKAKLSLVWKNTYTLTKTPQEFVDELVATRRTMKTPTKIQIRRSSSTFLKRSESVSWLLSVTPTIDKNALNTKVEREPSICLVKNFSLAPSPFTGYWNSKNVFSTKKASGNHISHLHYSGTGKRKAKRQATEQKQSKMAVTPSDFLDKKLKAIELSRKKLVPELQTKIDPNILLRAYLSEQFLGLRLEGPEAFELRRMYKNAIMDRTVIHNLIQKYPDMLPSRIFKDLVMFKKGFEVNPIYSLSIVKNDDTYWRQTYLDTLTPKSGSVLIELEKEVPMYANFIKPLLKLQAENVGLPEETWLKESNPHTLRNMLLDVTIQLRMSRNTPGSSIRFDLMKIMVATSRNERLLKQVGLSVDGWLDQLIKGLSSSFKSVREETIQVLCFMLDYYPLMKELYVSKYFDVIQDLTISVIRAMEYFDDTFFELYILMVCIIHYCPSRGTIDCLIDRWTSFRCVELMTRWPRLIYYALKYWPDDSLNVGSQLFGHRILKSLELAYQKPITMKASRPALFQLQKRFKNVSRLFTIHYNKRSANNSFIDAFVSN